MMPRRFHGRIANKVPIVKYYRLIRTEGEQHLAVEVEEGSLVALNSSGQSVADIGDLARAASLSGLAIDEIARRLLDSGPAESYDLARLTEDSRDGTGELWLDRPLDPPEVWAAGVTYKSSEMERRRESETPDVYSKVYAAERPELFLKATAERCVGPFESVGIRADSEWDVPEPELAFIVYGGEIVGYTAGNDMSSRSIEGENPLYLPQAKIYDRCCAIGPCFVTSEALGDPHNLTILCTVNRDGEEVFRGNASTSQMARECEELADWLQRHNPVPDLTAVLTGTAIVPTPEFTLHEGDVVTIEIEGIGVLENDVIVV
jgi:2-dehydro-3-deoxy-D-arabinonate dehydratase